MKNTDDQLRKVLRDKLDDYDSPVPDALWQNVASQLPQVKPHGIGLSLGKIAAIAIVSSIVTAAALFLSRSTPEIAQPGTTQSVERTVPDSVSNQAVETTNPAEEHLAEQAAVKTSTSDQNISLPAPAEESGPAQQQAHANTPEQTTTIAEAARVSATASEEAITTTTPSNPETKTDPRFSVIETDKSGLSFFFIPQHTDATHYTWSFGDGETSTEMSPSHHYDEAGEYTVELTIEGVSETFHQTITAIPNAVVEVPTIFTPNADGKNDTFDVMALSRFITVNVIQIFNTRGDRVFEGTGDTIWNGEDNHGNPLPEGNYIYTIKAKDLRQQAVEKSGTVYLRR